MRRLILGVLVVLLLGFSASAQRVFIDYMDGHLEIVSPKKARYKVTKRWTIHSADTKEEAYIHLQYGSFSQVRSINLRVYNQHGTLVHKANKSHFSDQNLSRGFEITSSRLLFYQYESSNYPFTLELEYQYDFDGLLFLPEFKPMMGDYCELDEASLTVVCPRGYQLRYKSNKVSKPHIDSTEKELTYQWHFSPQKSHGNHEVYSPNNYTAEPFVTLAPSDFEINKTQGSQRSWKDFGEWAYTLNEGRQELPEETAIELQDRFDSIADFRQKVEHVYQWMQNRTRYVSIQEGLGGWQPFSAEEVNSNGYGDCKALVNYTQSALKTVGIESFYTLIHASDKVQLDTSFCHQVFNHAILSVPAPDGDTIWLECTSQHAPANFLYSSTCGKYALMVKPGASQIVKTPDFYEGKAVSQSYSNVKLLVDGQAEIDFTSQYSFYFYEHMLALMFETKQQQEKELEEFLSVSSADIEDIFIHSSNEKHPEIHLESQIIAQGFHTKFGKSVAFSPWFTKSLLPEFPYNTARASAIEVKYNFTQADTIDIEIPDGFEIEYIPENLSTSSNLGSYSIEYTPTMKSIKCVLLQKLSKGLYPRENYEELYNLQQDIQKAFNRKIVIKVSET